MSDQFDIVVAGAGHNSLVAAAYLSKAGLRCLVLEGRAVLGGNVVTEELTLPGFRHDSCGTAHVILQDNPMMRGQDTPPWRIAQQLKEFFEVKNVAPDSQTALAGVNYNFAELRPSGVSGFVFIQSRPAAPVNRQPTDAQIGNVVITLNGTNDLGQPVNMTTGVVLSRSWLLT